MASVRRSSFVAPAPDLSGGFLFCGANPCWSPDRENQLLGSCILCGGVVLDAQGFPVERFKVDGVPDLLACTELLVHVCVCGRTPKRNLSGAKTEGNDEIARHYGRDLTTIDPEKVSPYRFQPKGARS